MKVVIISPPVGPLGFGLCGGVETTLNFLALQLKKEQHEVLVVAPKGSSLPEIPLMEIKGNFQPMMQLTRPDEEIELPNDSVLENMCEYVRRVQNKFDIILNFAYDWLPIYLTSFYRRPIVHWLTLSSCSEGFNTLIYKTIQNFPDRFAAFTQAQANTYQFSFKNPLRILGGGIALNNEQFSPYSDGFLAWIGRISPEKGLEDALEAVSTSQNPIKIMGCIQDFDYWKDLSLKFPQVHIEYLGFLSTRELYAVLRKAKALLVTSKCAESFGYVAVEALACGVPVIAYQQGGLTEIVKHEETGFLVDTGNIKELISSIRKVDQIDRHRCRQQAEEEYSFDMIYKRLMVWFQDIIEKQDNS